MTHRPVDLAKLIFEAEPGAALGEPAAVERVTLGLAKVAGAILSRFDGLERNDAPGCSVNTSLRAGSSLNWRPRAMHGIVYLVGLIVVVMALLSLLGVR